MQEYTEKNNVSSSSQGFHQCFEKFHKTIRKTTQVKPLSSKVVRCSSGRLLKKSLHLVHFLGIFCTIFWNNYFSEFWVALLYSLTDNKDVEITWIK